MATYKALPRGLAEASNSTRGTANLHEITYNQNLTHRHRITNLSGFEFDHITNRLYCTGASNIFHNGHWQVSGAGLHQPSRQNRTRACSRSARPNRTAGICCDSRPIPPIEGKLWEIKIGSHRVFYVMIDGEEMILLHAYKKQQHKLPIKERETALRRMKELLS